MTKVLAKAKARWWSWRNRRYFEGYREGFLISQHLTGLETRVLYRDTVDYENEHLQLLLMLEDERHDRSMD